MTMIYSSDLCTYNVKYFQTLSGEKWRSFANSLRNMLKLRSTLHEVAWQFKNLACISGHRRTRQGEGSRPGLKNFRANSVFRASAGCSKILNDK